LTKLYLSPGYELEDEIKRKNLNKGEQAIRRCIFAAVGTGKSYIPRVKGRKFLSYVGFKGVFAEPPFINEPTESIGDSETFNDILPDHCAQLEEAQKKIVLLERKRRLSSPVTVTLILS
jgi:hypothetical protein